MPFPKKEEKDKAVRINISMTPDILQRTNEYCMAEERPVSWVIRKALDDWLKERGY